MKRNQSEASAIQTSVNRTRTRVRRAVSRFVFANPVYYLSLLGRRPRQIAAIPTNPWLGESEQGTRLLGGKYCLAGETRGSDGLWTAPDASTAWRTELHGFGWLRDLHAVGSDAARRRARELVSDWIVRYSHWDPISWRIDVLATRVISWLTEYEFFCASADDRFRALYLASLAHQARHLSRIAPGQQGGLPRFVVIEALVLAGLALPNKGKRLARALKLLERELQRQVFPDGGHVERNPSAHLRVLRHLVDIRASLAARGQEVPQNLQKAIDRMTPVLRLFRHGDGRLALFNGSVEEENWLIDAVLNRADASGRAPDGIPHSGFQRLRAGQTLAIVETGVPPPRNFDRRGPCRHAQPRIERRKGPADCELRRVCR